MGFLDNIFKKKEKPKEEPKEEPKPKEEVQVQKEQVQPPKQTQIEEKKPLDLTKKIALNFEKLDLHKEDVRKKRLFALDVSGSMDNKIGEKRKIDHLRDVMSAYPDANILCFSSNVNRATGKSIPEPNGSTDLAKAFRYINENAKNITAISERPERIILVSDGEPDDEYDALEQSKVLSIPVDIIFIGKKDSKGYKFMQKLASTTGGQEFQVT
jgi:Mg-chelatase subunit ChlD